VCSSDLIKCNFLMLQISSHNEERLEEMGIHESWCLFLDEGL
jgi:hypothetical protein